MTPSPQLVAAVRPHQAGQFEAADRLYREAIAANPAEIHALHLCGVLAHQTNRNEEAVALIGRAIALDDRVPDFHYNIGLALWALRRRQEAMTHWGRVVALNPDHAEAHMNLGNALHEQHQLAEAAVHLRRAVAHRPQSPVAHNNLALEFVRIGRTDQALACVRRSLQIKETPDNTALFARVVGALDAVGDDPGLRQLITRAATEGWGRTSDLAGVAATPVKHGSAIEAQIARAESA